MSENFGSTLYNDIEKNAYLNELYECILYNYSLILFKNNKKEKKNININHALRFADILSKSVHPQNSEKHKIWAQEILALLNEIYPNNEDIKLYMGSVLTNTGNYHGLSQHPFVFTGTDLLDQLYNEYIRNFMSIPAEPEYHFFKSQKAVYDDLDKQYFSYSGPTSMGKSFVMRMFIKKQILDAEKKNFAIIVPTKALINEFSSGIINDLKELLATNNYRIVNSAGALVLKQAHNFILIMTPERLLYLLMENSNFMLDYLFIDEAHKISSSDSRSPFYYKVIDMVSMRSSKTHIIFSSPNIPNPEIYLKLIPSINQKEVSKLVCTYAPVSQTKYLVNLMTNTIFSYNDYSGELTNIFSFSETVRFTRLISLIGDNKQNIVYCSSTAKAVSLALDFANNYCSKYQAGAKLESLIKDIKNEIHGDYFLAKALEKGVAYHIGYLPSNIKMRIEELYKSGDIKTIFCTSTLLEGVNLPADNLFITSYKNGRANMDAVDFKNLVGRVGRIEYNLYGNIILVKDNEKIKSEKFENLLQNKVPEQKLSITSELTKVQKEKIVESLAKGEIELLRYPKKQSLDNYALMRRFSNMLLQDVLDSNNSSFVSKEFSPYLDDETINRIKDNFKVRSKVNDINISVDQMDNLKKAIEEGLEYPSLSIDGKFDYNDMLTFLETLCNVFKWDIYEQQTLGYRTKKNQKLGKLRWYTVILLQWMSGSGLSLIINEAIQYKQNNPKSQVEINREFIDYNDSKEHRNSVISSTLTAIEDVILFRISNYFLRFSLEYKKIHNFDKIQNDWYEYVEYGTTNPFTIFLQRNGFSRETSTYIKKNQKEYIMNIGGEYKLKMSLLTCSDSSVCHEAKEIKYNIPDLFID